MNKGTDQPLRGKSKQVFPTCLPSTTPLLSLTYVSAAFCGNNPIQTPNQLLTVTAQLQTKILTVINYQSKGILELCLYILRWHSSCKFKVLSNYILFKTNKQIYPGFGCLLFWGECLCHINDIFQDKEQCWYETTLFISLNLRREC